MTPLPLKDNVSLSGGTAEAEEQLPIVCSGCAAEAATAMSSGHACEMSATESQLKTV